MLDEESGWVRIKRATDSGWVSDQYVERLNKIFLIGEIKLLYGFVEIPTALSTGFPSTYTNLYAFPFLCKIPPTKSGLVI